MKYIRFLFVIPLIIFVSLFIIGGSCTSSQNDVTFTQMDSQSHLIKVSLILMMSHLLFKIACKVQHISTLAQRPFQIL